MCMASNCHANGERVATIAAEDAQWITVGGADVTVDLRDKSDSERRALVAGARAFDVAYADEKSRQRLDDE